MTFHVFPMNDPNPDLRVEMLGRLRAEFRAESLSVAHPGEMFLVTEDGLRGRLVAAFVNGDRVAPAPKEVA